MRAVQKNFISPYEHVVYAQPRICSGEWDIESSLGFWDTNRSPTLSQTTRYVILNNTKEKEKWPNNGLSHLRKIEKKRYKYLDPARELNETVEYEGDINTNCNPFTL